MAKYRNKLPQMSGKTFLTDGGLETSLIFLEEVDLPEFSAFVLLKEAKTREILKNYYRPYCEIARDNNFGFILESPTYRTSASWGKKLGIGAGGLDVANRDAIALMVELRREYENERSRFVISGCVGPEGDGYAPEKIMRAEEAANYHTPQVNTFSKTEADIISGFTLPYVEEAIGIARAASRAGMPSVIGFTVETDGRLPSGQMLGEAIEQVDAEGEGKPAYYMINCAHASHFEAVLKTDEDWVDRIHAVRANASSKSHAELDECTVLDDGNPEEFGRENVVLGNTLINLNILGGCCGTDHRHVTALAKTLRG